MKKYFAIATIAAFALPLTHVLAIDVYNPAGSLNVNTNTNTVNITDPYGSQSIQVDQGGVNLNRGTQDSQSNLNVRSTPGGLDMSVTDSEGSRRILLDGSNDPKTIQIIYGGQGLTIEAEDGLSKTLNLNVNGSSISITKDPVLRRSVVSLEGNSIALIKSDSDLKAYNQLVMEERPSIKKIEVNQNQVRVQYRQSARCLGIFKRSLTATAAVDDKGSVSVKVPWYGFLCSKDTGTVKAQIQTSLSNSEQNQEIQVNSLNVNLSNSGESVISVRSRAKVVNIMTSAIDNSRTINVSK
jgi:hypothetical protein